MDILKDIKLKLNSVVSSALQFTIYCVKIIISIVLIIWIAILLYGGFYYSYIPEIYYRREVHLQMKSDFGTGNRQQDNNIDQINARYSITDFCTHDLSSFFLTHCNL